MTTTLPLEGSAGELRNRIAGGVYTAEDPSFAELRLAWNRAYEHRPALVVVPSSAADVSAAVRHAAEWGMPVVVQATGHGVTRPAVASMLILTNQLDDVVVDGDAWTARMSGGAKWSDVLEATASHGLAPLLGSSPEVGAVGYTLGGGMGWLARKYGLAADHVRSIEIVTADGHIRRTSPDTEPDLFWALRGGGAGSFGVVTAMEIDLVPLTSLYAGNLFYPASIAREVAARYRDWVASVPDELTSAITFMNFPLTEDVPDEMRGNSLAILRGAFIGPDEDGEELLRYWRDWRKPEVDSWGRIPFADIACVSNDPVDPVAGLATSEFFDALTDDVIDILARALFEADGPSPLTLAEVRHAGGAIARTPDYPAAYGYRNHQLVLELNGVAETEESLAALHAFAAATQAQLAPRVAGRAYLNFLEGEERVRRSSEAFPPETWERLKNVKAAYDPQNVFSHGIAITP